MKVQLSADSKKILIGTSWAERNRARSIPGARWNPRAKCWSMPATPGYLERVDALTTSLDDVDCETLRPLLDARRAAHSAELPMYAYKTKPWAHQEGAIAFACATDAALLHMWMGCGKTWVTLNACAVRGHKTILILCPKAIIRVWEKEIEKHGSVPFSVLALRDGSVADRAKRLQWFISGPSRRPRVVIVNYEAAWRSKLAETISMIDWDCLVFDESSKIKAPGSKVSRFCAKIKAGHRLALTGTPMPHSPLDVYGQYRALDPGIFGTSFTKFRGEYALMGGYEGREVMGFRNEDDLRRRMDTIRYEVKADALDLPDIQTVDVPVSLDNKSRAHYLRMSADFLTEVESGVVTASNALAKLLRLQQITSGFLPFEDTLEKIGNEKADAMAEIMAGAGKEPVVVFCRFRHDLKLVRETAAKLKRTHGEISGRGNDLDAWDAGDVDIMAVQIQAGGMGIDLTRARYAIYYSLGYSLGDYQQTIARVHRPGQTRPVTIYRLLAEKTIDEKIVKALDGKRKVIDDILSEARRSMTGE